MRKSYIIILLAIASTLQARADAIEYIVNKVLQDNPTLMKYRAQTDAEKSGNHVGTTLANPEIEFNYLWGAPHNIGQRKDISIRQSFDYATVFGLKRKEAKSKDDLAEIKYEQARLILHQEIIKLLSDVASANEICNEYAKRIEIAEMIAANYKNKLNEGESNKIEYNNSRLNLATVKAEARQAEIARLELIGNALFHATLNENDCKTLKEITIANLRKYIENIQVKSLQQIEQEKNILEENALKAEFKTSQSANIPELTVGYMAELTEGEKFRGLTFGLSIPLWNNRGNKTKYKAAVIAMQSERDETIAKINAQRESIATRLQHLRTLYDSISTDLKEYNNESLLRKSVQEGAISLMEYLADYTIYYDLKTKQIETSHDYLSNLIELYTLGAQAF